MQPGVSGPSVVTGVVETAADFLKRRAGKARPEDMLPFLDKAKKETPPKGDEIQ